MARTYGPLQFLTAFRGRARQSCRTESSYISTPRKVVPASLVRSACRLPADMRGLQFSFADPRTPKVHSTSRSASRGRRSRFGKPSPVISASTPVLTMSTAPGTARATCESRRVGSSRVRRRCYWPVCCRSRCACVRPLLSRTHVIDAPRSRRDFAVGHPGGIIVRQEYQDERAPGVIQRPMADFIVVVVPPFCPKLVHIRFATVAAAVTPFGETSASCCSALRAARISC